MGAQEMTGTPSLRDFLVDPRVFATGTRDASPAAMLAFQPAVTSRLKPIAPKQTLETVQCPHCGAWLDLVPTAGDASDIAECASCSAYFHVRQAYSLRRSL